MTAGLVVYALVAGSLVALAAAGVDGVCRLTRRPVRWVWAGAMALTLGLVAAAPLRVSEPAVQARGPAPAAVAGPSGTVGVEEVGLRELAGRLGAAVGGVVAGGAGRVPEGVARGLAVGWPSLSALLLLAVAATHLRYRRMRLRWPAAELHGLPIRVSPSTGPAVVGWLRPSIVVPGWLLRLEPEVQRIVLAHEREHLRGRDPLLLALGCLTAALLPWHPAMWWMLSRLRLAVELDCDARVIGQGIRPAPYGRLLIDLAGRCTGEPLGAPALADHPSHLQRRLVAMTPTTNRFILPRAAALGAVAVLGLVAACEARLPTAAEIESMDVAAAEAGASRMRISADPEAVYFVNGLQVTAEEARALAADRIVELSVSRPAAGGSAHYDILTSDAPAPPAPAVPAAEPEPAAPPAPPAPPSDPPGKPRISASGDVDFPGLVLIDGVPAAPGALAKLVPERIASMEVIKGSRAREISADPRAVHGIIRVTTRQE